MPLHSILLPSEVNCIIAEVEEPLLVKKTRSHATKILDAVYSPGDLRSLVDKNNQNLDKK